MTHKSYSIKQFISALGKDIDAVAVQFLINKYDLIRDKVGEVTYFESINNGISLESESNKVLAVFLHAHGKDEFCRFKGCLPYSLNFESTQSDVRRTMGSSSVISTGMHAGNSQYGRWDRYDFNGYFIHFTYNLSDNTLELVTFQELTV